MRIFLDIHGVADDRGKMNKKVEIVDFIKLTSDKIEYGIKHEVRGTTPNYYLDRGV